MDIIKDPIPPEHFYVPQEENDPVRDTIHQIFREAAKPILNDATYSLEQRRELLETRLQDLLLDTFTSRYAQPTSQVLLTTTNNWPVFHIGVMVYGHTFTATMS